MNLAGIFLGLSLSPSFLSSSSLILFSCGSLCRAVAHTKQWSLTHSSFRKSRFRFNNFIEHNYLLNEQSINNLASLNQVWHQASAQYIHSLIMIFIDITGNEKQTPTGGHRNKALRRKLRRWWDRSWTAQQRKHGWSGKLNTAHPSSQRSSCDGSADQTYTAQSYFAGITTSQQISVGSVGSEGQALIPLPWNLKKNCWTRWTREEKCDNATH